MKIQKLAPQEAQKIAAGEVVERPANIVKELVENSIDAGATVVTISAFEGGKTSLAVSDNGSGMSVQDALLSIERHTTSKITTIDELSGVTTFGFRGEALASICSVARVTLITRTADSLEGVKLTIEQGNILKKEVVGCQVGTTIEINDLFYIIPVRKKFLKATSTEWNHILSLIKACTLNHPTIHFVLKHNNETVLNCPPVTAVLDRIQQLFEPPLTQYCIAVETHTENGITVTGAITTHHYSRYDRGGMFFFVNNRWVKNHQLGSAVMKGYMNVLHSGKYPAAVLMITVDPLLVDVNVHPKKEEVSFVHPQKVATAITHAVKNTLESNLSAQLKRTVTLAPSQPRENFIQRFNQPSVFPQGPFFETQSHQTPFEQINYSQPLSIPDHPFEKQQQTTINQPNIQEESSFFDEYTLIGQYHKTYLLLEVREGLMIVDQHAAHERILYERFKKRFEALEPITLLFPFSVTVNSMDLDLLEQHYELFQEYGVHIERMGNDQLMVKATPVFLKNQPLDDLIYQTIGWLKESTTLNPEDLHKKITEKIRAQMACKAAVKAGDILTHETMEQLLKDLASVQNRCTCPHGRPTSWMVTLSDLEKQFKRKL